VQCGTRLHTPSLVLLRGKVVELDEVRHALRLYASPEFRAPTVASYLQKAHTGLYGAG
jgi:hypothetical protein